MKYNNLSPLAIMVELDSSTADQISHVHNQIEDLLAKMKVLQKRKEEEDTLEKDKLKRELAVARKEQSK